MSRAALPLLLALLLLPSLSSAACPTIPRSAKVLRDFQRGHPCPSTGKTTGACPGWIRDHKWPLCAGGTDTVDNLVWSPKAEAALKDRWERILCRRLGCEHRGD
jgi:hypothetical protein